MLILELILDWSQARLNKTEMCEKKSHSIFITFRKEENIIVHSNIGDGLRAYWHITRCDIIYYLYKSEPRYAP